MVSTTMQTRITACPRGVIGPKYGRALIGKSIEGHEEPRAFIDFPTRAPLYSDRSSDRFKETAARDPRGPLPGTTPPEPGSRTGGRRGADHQAAQCREEDGARAVGPSAGQGKLRRGGPV